MNDPTKPSNDRVISLWGEVNEESIKDVCEKILAFSSSDDRLSPITLLLSTYGGYVDEALALYDVIKHSPCPIHTVGVGKIMSAGCLILAAGDFRLIGANARLMYHSAYGHNSGDPGQMKLYAKEDARQQKQFDQIVAKETGKTLKQVVALYTGEARETYMMGAAAVKFGFADALLE